MAHLPPLLNVNIVAAKILSAPVTPLDQPVPYDGKALHCRATAAGTQLQFTIDGTAPNKLDSIGGTLNTAALAVSYRGRAGAAGPLPVGYSNGEFDYYLRLDATLSRATMYVVEKPVALTVAALDTPADSAAAPPSGQLVFVAIADGGSDDPSTPYKVVFVDNQIVVPDYLNHRTATIMFGPPALDGGGEFGPMAIRVDP